MILKNVDTKSLDVRKTNIITVGGDRNTVIFRELL